MAIEILDPSHESAGAPFAAAPRLDSLEGKTVAIVSNGKKGTQPFFGALERELKEGYRVAEVVRLTKSNYSAPAEPPLLRDSARWHALVSGIGD
jgi:hypothetical protein